MENKNGRSRMDVAVTVVSIIISVAVIVLAGLQIAGVWEDAINLVVPLLGVSSLCQAYTQWDRSRKIAYFSLGTAIFIFICAVVVFFVK